MSDIIYANWTVKLETDCPECKHTFDLLDDPDFWDGRDFEVGEHGTLEARDVPVWCPKCSTEFEVDLQY